MLSIETESAIELKRASRCGELLTNRHLSLPNAHNRAASRTNFTSVCQVSQWSG